MIPQTPRTCEHLVRWCWCYQHSEIVPRSQEVRFAIAVYQISQGLSWPGGPVAWQSYCSAAMHALMVGAAHSLSLSEDLPETLDQIPDSFAGWRDLMRCLGDVQQQVVYHLHLNVFTTRKSRHCPYILRLRLVRLVGKLFSLVPPEAREQGCFDEMVILTKDLIKSPNVKDDGAGASPAPVHRIVGPSQVGP
jgi:hypothetical protein